MILTNGEVNNLFAILCQIKTKAGKKDLPKNTIENLCDKAKVILKRADRKHQRITKLHFEQTDIQI